MLYLRLTITQDVIIQFSVETNSTVAADGMDSNPCQNGIPILLLEYISIKTGWVR